MFDKAFGGTSGNHRSCLLPREVSRGSREDRWSTGEHGEDAHVLCAKAVRGTAQGSRSGTRLAMNMIKNKASEREEIETLLPWHAAGTLSRRDAQKVEQALASDADLAVQYATVQQDLVETIGLNESLGAPSARAMQKLMADIEADATARRARSSFNLGEWLSERLSSFSPRTLAWSATAAALAVVLQAGLLAGMFVSERQGGSFQTASVQTDQAIKGGTYALIRFAPEATTGDVNKLLENYKITIVDGPSGGGVYTVRLAVTGMPKEELARTVKTLQDESVVRFIGPKPTE